jgi:hypothetical protein
MRELTPDRFKEGMRITCEILNENYSDTTKIKDAKLHCEDGRWYICQNKINGLLCINRLGYNGSWVISSGSKKDLKFHRIISLQDALSIKDKIRILKKELNK